LSNAVNRDWESEISDAGNHYVAVRGLQEPQLHNDKKQKEALRPFGDEKVLQFVPQAHGAQGSEVAVGRTVLVLGESSNR
jgi:hypothetical protein